MHRNRVDADGVAPMSPALSPSLPLPSSPKTRSESFISVFTSFGKRPSLTPLSPKSTKDLEDHLNSSSSEDSANMLLSPQPSRRTALLSSNSHVHLEGILWKRGLLGKWKKVK